MDMLGYESIDCVLQGESSHVGRIKITKRGLGDGIEEAIAFRTALRMSSGSYYFCYIFLKQAVIILFYFYIYIWFPRVLGRVVSFPFDFI